MATPFALHHNRVGENTWPPLTAIFGRKKQIGNRSIRKRGAPRAPLCDQRAVCLCRGPRQGLIQIGDQIIGIFDPDRDPHHIGRGTGGLLLFGRQLAVRGRSRMDDQ